MERRAVLMASTPATRSAVAYKDRNTAEIARRKRREKPTLTRAKFITYLDKHFMKLEQAFKKPRNHFWRAIADKFIRSEAVYLVAVQT